ncbi:MULTISPECIES: MIP/aquaporin family protein [Komagataeibacter]|uniref:Glycerol uptake facilitator protein n=1 Tax=Komagataeibacter saccharivorans TaxID=265959 RepID=A0A347WFC2_9PROT|nr:MIP/aquaporin family protein [Komagataeibacter saccharivorans]MBL7236113.1 aquaporin family protein [Novacetimonas hansenii]AXY23565.1 Glycerol uptake facilitator protein [Komagataeibacter saccharivorans]PYD50439.1 aquaporin [Komagataeibacter saccharivorans]QBL92538.1 Glycerol uptake facilitator protein [Komagataeibacter saccharivorans]GBQ41137.1 glycerol uptake transporter [Komagataeibacter saccharivorans NRIC 0614]
MLKNRQFLGELISECIAVIIIVMVGDSVAAMYTLYDPSPYKFSYWGVCIVWGLGVTIAIYITGSVSGTHANPAVSIALALYRDFPWRKVPAYCAAQVLGGFIGAALVYALYQPVIDHYNQIQGVARADGGAAGVFFTHAGDFITPLHAFMDETILTGLLLFGIFAITCEYNTVAPQANSSALIIGLLVASIGACSGYLEAWAINPARDFGPRLFCYLMGWGSSALPAPGSFWWVPIAGPVCGGVLGAGGYQFLIRPFIPRQTTLPTPPTP